MTLLFLNVLVFLTHDSLAGVSCFVCSEQARRGAFKKCLRLQAVSLGKLPASLGKWPEFLPQLATIVTTVT